MPSIVLSPVTASGGSLLTSGDPFSGRPLIGGVLLRVGALTSSPGSVFYGVNQSGANASGQSVYSGDMTINSGGLRDGMEIPKGQEAFVPKAFASGLQAIRVNVLADGSGARLYWEPR